MASQALKRLTQRGRTDASIQFPSDLGTDKSKYYVLFKILKTAPTTTPKINFVAGTGNSKNTYLSRPFVKDPEFIALYMPASISNIQNASYQSAELGLLASVMKATSGGSGLDGLDFSSLAAAGSEALVQGLKSGSAEAKSLADIGQISSGKVVNNRTELIFDNIDRRSFTFDFKMIPKSESEALEIKKIVKKFRSNMAPNFDGVSDSGKTMIVPSTFEIEFKPNQGNYLPRIGPSVCTSCSVTYGGARPQFYSGGSPVETSMTVTFQELEMITGTRIESGF